MMSDTVVPRPIAWIVTEEESVPKDSLYNILKHKKATICFVNKDYTDKLKLCANMLEKNISEIDEYKIEVQKPLDDYPAMIS